MKGVQHCLGGVAAWLVAVPVLDVTTGLTDGQTVLGGVLSAGGGLLSDLDQRGSTVGRTYGPVTNLSARIVGGLSGGHRNGTHSILGVVAFAAVALFAVHVGGVALFLALWLLIGAADSGLGISPRKWSILGLGHAVIMAAVTGVILGTGVAVGVPLVAGTVLGVVSHIGLDMLNPQRCPLFWLPRWIVRRLPDRARKVCQRRYGHPITRVGSWASPLVSFVLGAVVLALLVLQPTLGRLVG